MEEARLAVEDKLIEQFPDKPEDLSRVLFFLDKEEKSVRDLEMACVTVGPVMDMLCRLIPQTEAFVALAAKVAQETRTPESDAQFWGVIESLHDQMLSYSCGDDDDDDGGHDSQLTSLESAASEEYSVVAVKSVAETTAFDGLVRVWDRLGSATRIGVLSLVRQRVKVDKSSPLVVVGKALGLVLAAPVFVALLAGIALAAAADKSWVAVRGVADWYRGRISGRRCAKNIVDAFFSVSAGVAGGVAGAALGTVILPGIGTFVGGAILGHDAFRLAEKLVDYLTQKIFDLPKEVAVENAYRFFGLHWSATEQELNQSYRRLCLERHPDKEGGSHEAFIEVQVNMQIIKEARGPEELKEIDLE